jgi:uncharacterized membrane protein YebE (DUF533 family)
MFDPKKLLDDLLGSKIPGTGSTVRDKAGQATQLAKDNPLAAGALVAVLLGTGARAARSRARRVKLGGLAAVGGLAYKAYQNYQKPAMQPEHRKLPPSRCRAATACRRPPTIRVPPIEQAPQGEDRVRADGADPRHDRRRQG